MNYSQEFQTIIRAIGRGKKLQRDLTVEEAQLAMQLVLSGEASDAQVGSLLITMRVKEETVEEIIGFLAAVRDLMQPMPVINVENLVDIALPYDGKAKNLQTGVIATLIIAAAGVPVLLHGADDIPTKHGVGVLNLLREFGYPVDVAPADVARHVEQSNFGVLNLSHVLPGWTDITPIRHHFGLRTLMNTIEKFFNPANAPRHISGFYHGNYLARLAPVTPGADLNWIIQGEEGGIDLRPGKKTNIFKAVGGTMQQTVINAADYGFTEHFPLEAPNNPAHHAECLKRILHNEPDPARDQIILTAGTLLWMLEAVDDIPTGLETADNILQTGKIHNLLKPAIVQQ